MGLWRDEKEKLEKSGRKWAETEKKLPYRYAELFCEKCGKSLGLFDMVVTNVETNMFCEDCVKEFVRPVPIELTGGTIVKDNGGSVIIEYKDNFYDRLRVEKICYFNKKGRYIKVKGKRNYV